jgi:hypothetical protein
MLGIDRVSFKQPSLPGAISIAVLVVVPIGLVAPSWAQKIYPPATSTPQEQNSDRSVSKGQVIIDFSKFKKPNKPAQPVQPAQPAQPPQPAQPVQPPQADRPNDGGIVLVPLPEEQTKPSAYVQLAGGRLTVTLKNNTNAPLSYEVMGHTQVRTLSGNEEVLLQDLPAPVTITINRDDGGLLVLTPETSDGPGTLRIALDATNTLNTQKSTMTIDDAGRVILN